MAAASSAPVWFVSSIMVVAEGVSVLPRVSLMPPARGCDLYTCRHVTSEQARRWGHCHVTFNVFWVVNLQYVLFSCVMGG